MVKCRFLCFILSIYFSLAAAVDEKSKCQKCMPAEKCPLYENMNKEVQKTWDEQFPCNENEDDAHSSPFGFAPVAKGDNICCPDSNIWGIEGTNKQMIDQDSINNQKRNDQQIDGQISDFDNDQNLSHDNQNSEIDSNENNKYEQSRLPVNRRFEPQFNRNSRRPQKLTNHNPNFNGNHVGNNLNGHYVNDPIPYGNLNLNRNNPNFNGNNPNFNGQNPNFNRNNPSFNGNNPNFNRNNPSFNGNNPNFNRNDPNNNANNLNYNANNPNFNGATGNNRNEGSLSNKNGNNAQTLGGQCSALTSFPPDPQTGCCGRDESFSNRIAGQQFYNRRAPNPNLQNRPPTNSWSNNQQRRYKRETEDSIDITFDNRIAGGKETELEQFPWTVLLKATFDYGNRKASFNCGGAIISAQYVLTAAHCVNEEGARLSNVEINLAEYDKRTFPQDCKNVLGEGRKCIQNIVMQAEDIIAHPEFDDQKLQNDIALIRLRGNAPYTDYIRPICLPPINIDNPDFFNLRLAVAGWGRNGSIVSQVKQSTVVNLVPQQECIKSYPHLTKKHLCAAGHSGEDTCKGDSGGPLMMLYEGKYFVSGLVSGKRADSPCGTSVPSLYTNVYHFLDWIKRNIRN